MDQISRENHELYWCYVKLKFTFLSECKICSHQVVHLFRTEVLKKYTANYFACTNCSFIQTEVPFWLNEAYEDAITSLDIGLVFRNEAHAPLVSLLIDTVLNPEGSFLDFGGGYGLFVRMMRDRGYNFFRQDTYCDNLFAKGFDIDNAIIPLPPFFELVTAFEVMEHLPDPVGGVENMLRYGKRILFSTELQPERISSVNDWWYFIPETGQHVSLYSKRSLELLANRFSLHYYQIDAGLHFFTPDKTDFRLFSICKRKKFVHDLYRKIFCKKRNSLLMTDFKLISGKQ